MAVTVSSGCRERSRKFFGARASPCTAEELVVVLLTLVLVVLLQVCMLVGARAAAAADVCCDAADAAAGVSVGVAGLCVGTVLTGDA